MIAHPVSCEAMGGGGRGEAGSLAVPSESQERR